MKHIKILRGTPCGPSQPVLQLISRVAVGLLSVSIFTMSHPYPVPAAPGDLDPSFGGGDVVSTDFGSQSQSRAVAMALQPNGQIVVAGIVYPGHLANPRFAVARYNADGSLDASFGSGGTAMTDFGSPRGDVATAVALQPDDKIVLAGSTTTSGGDNFALARYNADGSLDQTFGNGGKVTTEFSGFDRASAVSVQRDGKIVVVGTSSRGFSDFVLVRYSADGALDASFGNGGRVISDFAGGDDAVSGLALQPDGKILVLGVVGPPPPPPSPPIPCRTFPFCFGLGGPSLGPSFPTLVRYNPDGSLDATFGSGGKVPTGLPPTRAFTLQPDGRIVVLAGFIHSGGSDLTIARFNPDGSLDSSFGVGGKVIADYNGDFNDQLAVLALQPDGKFLAVLNSTRGLVVARYNPNGTPDPTFGNGGTATTDFPGSSFGASDLTFQPDGKILVAGTTTSFRGSPDFALARFEGGPTSNAPILGLHLSQTAFVPTETLRVDVTIANPGPAFDADLYFGNLLPDGVTLIFVTHLAPPTVVASALTGDPRNFQPVLTNLRIPQGLTGGLVTDFPLSFAGVEPSGEYLAFAVLAKPGAARDGRIDPGDILAITMKPFTYSELTAPTLITPINNAAFKQSDPSNGCSLHRTRGFGWNLIFDWTDSHSLFGIARYEMLVKHKDRAFSFGNPPFGQFFVIGSEFVDRRCAAFVSDDLLDGWEWRVRAVDNFGNVGPWSETGTFRFEPCRLADGRPCSGF